MTSLQKTIILKINLVFCVREFSLIVDRFLKNGVFMVMTVWTCPVFSERYDVRDWYQNGVDTSKSTLERMVERVNISSTKENPINISMPVADQLMILELNREKQNLKGKIQEAAKIRQVIHNRLRSIDSFAENPNCPTELVKAFDWVLRLREYAKKMRLNNAATMMHQVGIEPLFAAFGVSGEQFLPDVHAVSGTMQLLGADNETVMQKNPGLNLLCWVAQAHFGKQGWALGLVNVLVDALEYYEMAGRLENAFKCAMILLWAFNHAEFENIKENSVNEETNLLVDRMMFALASLVPANQKAQELLLQKCVFQNPKAPAMSQNLNEKLEQQSAVVQLLCSYDEQPCRDDLPWLVARDVKEGDVLASSLFYDLLQVSGARSNELDNFKKFGSFIPKLQDLKDEAGLQSFFDAKVYYLEMAENLEKKNPTNEKDMLGVISALSRKLEYVNQTKECINGCSVFKNLRSLDISTYKVSDLFGSIFKDINREDIRKRKDVMNRDVSFETALWRKFISQVKQIPAFLGGHIIDMLGEYTDSKEEFVLTKDQVDLLHKVSTPTISAFPKSKDAQYRLKLYNLLAGSKGSLCAYIKTSAYVAQQMRMIRMIKVLLAGGLDGILDTSNDSFIEIINGMVDGDFSNCCWLIATMSSRLLSQMLRKLYWAMASEEQRESLNYMVHTDSDTSLIFLSSAQGTPDKVLQQFCMTNIHRPGNGIVKTPSFFHVNSLYPIIFDAYFGGGNSGHHVRKRLKINWVIENLLKGKMFGDMYWLAVISGAANDEFPPARAHDYTEVKNSDYKKCFLYSLLVNK